jgi:predicted nucleic acid-binding protein
MALQTRNVFIDTQVFVKAGLEFTSRTIQAFADVCAKGDLKHITTRIVVGEVNDKISEHIKEALDKVKEFRRKAKILSGSQEPNIVGLFAEFDSEQVKKHAQEVFQAFLEESDSTVLDLKRVDADEVFRRYFEHEPPFQEGKKKSEFPDAFSMLALDTHLAEQDEIYIVSEDTDLIAFCTTHGRFHIVDSLSKLLDIYNTHDTQRSEFIKGYLEGEKEKIRAEIERQVNEASFYNHSTWEDAEVENHHVVSVEDFEPSIIYISDEDCQISFEVSVRYSVTVEGPDFVNGTYDREEGRMFTFGKSRQDEEGVLELTIEGELDFEVKNGSFVAGELNLMVLGLSSGIEVSVDEVNFH